MSAFHVSGCKCSSLSSCTDSLNLGLIFFLSLRWRLDSNTIVYESPIGKCTFNFISIKCFIVFMFILITQGGDSELRNEFSYFICISFKFVLIEYIFIILAIFLLFNLRKIKRHDIKKKHVALHWSFQTLIG